MPTYYALVRGPGETTGPRTHKRCGACRSLNRLTNLGCFSCGARLVRRPKAKKDRSVAARLASEGALLDQWLTKLALAATKIRYYRSRVKALERARLTEGQPRPKRPPRPQRAIRLRGPAPQPYGQPSS